MAKVLYADVTGTDLVENINIQTSHSSSVATATIRAIDTDLDIGDEINIDMGYVDDHGQIFNGYVKNIDHITPENTYQITAMDRLIRAVDYFVVSSNPEEPYDFGTSVPAESLVNSVLGLAGLSLYDFHPTHFEFGVTNPVEVNLVSAFDYCRMIADVVTWSLWCDEYGNIHFKNRKPFLMGSEDFGQLEWNPDVSINSGSPLDSTQILSFSYKRDEKDLRNRVSVFGGGGIASTRDNGDSWDDLYGPSGGYITVLPADYYKTIVASYIFIEDQTTADDIAEYNLGLYNRIRNSLSVSCEGNHRFLARRAITIKEWNTGFVNPTDWYILSSTMEWGRNGFTTAMELTR